MVYNIVHFELIGELRSYLSMIELSQRSNPAKAPRKKFRGKRAYFRRILKDASEFRLEVSSGDWWDLWHHHADWVGWGNLRWKYRKQHIEALRIVYDQCAAAMERCPQPFQLWMLLCPDDAGQDAVYVHTRNPNCDNFPYIPPDTTWCERSCDTPLAPKPARIGFCVHEGITCYFIYLRDIGIPLEERMVITQGQAER